MYQDSRAGLNDLVADALTGDPAAVGFDVHYQPIVQIEHNAPLAVEALARWSHPTLGDIRPSVFVRIAESLGLVGVIDDFVLDRACADAGSLARAYGHAVDVHVNISASRLGHRNLDLAVVRALARHRIQPHRLVLEITETSQIVDLCAAVGAARRLRELGVRIALDDFGAGFNWLRRLHDLPLDIVKLDATTTRVQIDPARTEAICKALLALCDELRLTIIAEGIESPWQADALARLGCAVGQGYLYGTPQPLARVAPLSPRTVPLRVAV